ncbi:hypothetical protein BIV25_38695 [Streptomyces sp. MUSC 14]|nr:hypothetical protein BIV25_38695 [Streptomyces sp. MUSC 14]
MLLLDEATANLDLVTEARVAAAMQHVSGRRTTIVIAHRLQTARTADRIAVFDRGRIIEIGSHDDLLGQNGRYARMWQAYEGAAVSAADGVLRDVGRHDAGAEERVGQPGVASP